MDCDITLRGKTEELRTRTWDAIGCRRAAIGRLSRGSGRALIAKKVVGSVMIIEILARYDARPRPPSDPRQLNVRIFWPVSVDRAWPRLVIGAVFRSFSGCSRLWVFLKSFASCDGCEVMGIVWQGCDKSMRSTCSNSWTSSAKDSLLPCLVQLRLLCTCVLPSRILFSLLQCEMSFW